MGIPRAARRVQEAAARRGLSILIEEFPEGTKTARDAAAAVGCPVSAIVKSLVFVVGDRPVLALVPGDRRLDPDKLARVAGGGKARRASLEEVREATGYAAGGTPPFGHDTELAVYADQALRRHEELWAAAGTPTTVFRVGPTELARASEARWADLSA